jgi:hypothetical protein
MELPKSINTSNNEEHTWKNLRESSPMQAADPIVFCSASQTEVARVDADRPTEPAMRDLAAGNHAAHLTLTHLNCLGSLGDS